mgnify:CR=1 FL=1
MEMYIHLRDDMNQVLAFNPNTYGKFEPVRKYLKSIFYVDTWLFVVFQRYLIYDLIFVTIWHPRNVFTNSETYGFQGFVKPVCNTSHKGSNQRVVV